MKFGRHGTRLSGLQKLTAFLFALALTGILSYSYGVAHAVASTNCTGTNGVMTCGGFSVSGAGITFATASDSAIGSASAYPSTLFVNAVTGEGASTLISGFTLQLANNVALKSLDSGGTARALLYADTNNLANLCPAVATPPCLQVNTVGDLILPGSSSTISSSVGFGSDGTNLKLNTPSGGTVQLQDNGSPYIDMNKASGLTLQYPGTTIPGTGITFESTSNLPTTQNDYTCGPIMGLGALTGQQAGACSSSTVSSSYQNQVWPRKSLFKNLFVAVATAPGASKNFIFTLVDGTTAEALTCTIAGTATTCSDLSHSFTVTAGDLLMMQIQCTGGTCATNGATTWAMEPLPSD